MLIHYENIKKSHHLHCYKLLPQRVDKPLFLMGNLIMENQEEIWKDIKDYEGLYQISSLANVKSLKRVIKRKDNTIQTFNSINTKIYISSNGYPSVSLSKNGKGTMKNIHSLMAIAFIDYNYIEKGLVVNHKNGIKTDNTFINLEVVSFSENLTHSYNNNLNKHYGEKSHFSKFNNEIIEEVKNMISNGYKTSLIAQKYNMSKCYVREIKRNEKRKRT